jgi:signal transduction histidine kinase
MEPQSERVERQGEPSEQELGRRRDEASEALVRAALRAYEAADEAEKSEKEQVAVAELRERLLGILGHDLQNPLGAMVMGLRILLARRHLAEDDAEVVRRVLQAGDRMGRMISQLLDLTRARLGGGLLLEFEEVNLRDVCQAVVEECQLAKSARIMSIVEGDLRGRWDADHLTEVLMNIVGNAVEHARPGSNVVVHAHQAESGVVVEVSNEGQPIPADLLPFIFDPFRRAKVSKYTKAGNLGLGLYIASEIVRGHGGTLDARSGGGITTLTMRLPRSPSPRDQPPRGEMIPM